MNTVKLGYTITLFKRNVLFRIPLNSYGDLDKRDLVIEYLQTFCSNKTHKKVIPLE